MKTRTKQISRAIAVAAILGSRLGISDAWAQSQVDTNALLQRIEDLEQQVKILQRRDELSDDAAADKAKTTPTVVIDQNGLSAQSANTNFVVQLHGVVQFDNRTFFNDGGIQGHDGFLLRRARPILSGTLYKDFDFMFVPDFGGSTVQIYDAYLNYRFEPWLQFEAGKYKAPVGLEQLQQDRNTLFNERSLVTDLVPNRDLGFMAWGSIDDGVASYAAGVFSGVGDARLSSNADVDNNVTGDGRLFFQPFKQTSIEPLQGLGFGIAGSYGNSISNSTALPNTTGGTLPGYTTDGQQQFFAYNPTNGVVAASGLHWRLSPQAYYYWGPLGLMGEYAISDEHVRNGGNTADLDNRAWEVSGSWVLTGEDASFNGVTPRHPFDPRAGHWGAFQLVGRLEELDIDHKAFPDFANPATSASEATGWSAGFNWYLNRDVKLAASYSHTAFAGGGGAAAPGPVTRRPEEVFFTRLQLAF
jgi:phosphate-selective porin OprO and OprP